MTVRSISILSSYLRLRLPTGLFLFGFPSKLRAFISPVHNTCSTYIILQHSNYLPNWIYLRILAYTKVSNCIISSVLFPYIRRYVQILAFPWALCFPQFPVNSPAKSETCLRKQPLPAPVHTYPCSDCQSCTRQPSVAVFRQEVTRWTQTTRVFREGRISLAEISW